MLAKDLNGVEVTQLHIRRSNDGKLRVRGTSTARILDAENDYIAWDRSFGFPTEVRELVDKLAINLSIKESTSDAAVFKYLNDHYTNASDKFDILVTYSDTLRKFVKEASKHPVQILQLDEWAIENPEIEWLRNHTRIIKAVLPSKQSYIQDFEKAFPGAPYKCHEGQWGWSFKMFFDQNTDYNSMPESLKYLSNNDPLNPCGRAVDPYRGTLSCAGYIWRLVTDYPEYFAFGE